MALSMTRLMKIKNLHRKRTLDKVLRDKTFGFSKNLKYVVYQRGIASMMYKFFDRKIFGGAVKNKIMANQLPLDLATQQIAETLCKPFIRKFGTRMEYLSFKSNIWGTENEEMQLIIKTNKKFLFLLCVISYLS